MHIKPIRTESDYDAALNAAGSLMDAKPGTPEADQLEVIALLIEQYEKSAHPIGNPDPVEAIRFRMEQMGIGQTELSDILGSRSRASEILQRKRHLSLQMIRKLQRRLRIPAETLIQPYDLAA